MACLFWQGMLRILMAVQQHSFASLTLAGIRQMPVLVRFGCFVHSLLEGCLSDAEAILFFK